MSQLSEKEFDSASFQNCSGFVFWGVFVCWLGFVFVFFFINEFNSSRKIGHLLLCILFLNNPATATTLHTRQF